MAVTWGDIKTRVSKRAHQNLQQQISIDSVEEAVKSGIELMENEEAWEWLKVADTLTMSSLVYYIAWPAYLTRFDSKSFRYAGAGSYLSPARDALDLDNQLGPTWRTDTAKAGTPKYITDFGRQFWIAPMPSAAFIATPYTSLYYYGWKTDLYGISQISSAATQAVQDATELLLPLHTVESYVQASLVCLLQERDDPEWKDLEDTWYNKTLPKMRRFKAGQNDDTRKRPSTALTGRRW